MVRRLARDDLMYRPPDAGYEWLDSLAPSACLCVGLPPEREMAGIRRVAADLRGVVAAEGLHRGTYAVRIRGAWRAIVVFVGREPRSNDQGRSRSLVDGHLVTALRLFTAQWGDAGPIADRPVFARCCRPRRAIGTSSTWAAHSDVIENRPSAAWKAIHVTRGLGLHTRQSARATWRSRSPGPSCVTR